MWYQKRRFAKKQYKSRSLWHCFSTIISIHFEYLDQFTSFNVYTLISNPNTIFKVMKNGKKKTGNNEICPTKGYFVALWIVVIGKLLCIRMFFYRFFIFRCLYSSFQMRHVNNLLLNWSVCDIKNADYYYNEDALFT